MFKWQKSWIIYSIKSIAHSQKEKLTPFTRPYGLIDKNPFTKMLTSSCFNQSSHLFLNMAPCLPVKLSTDTDLSSKKRSKQSITRKLQIHSIQQDHIHHCNPHWQQHRLNIFKKTGNPFWLIMIFHSHPSIVDNSIK